MSRENYGLDIAKGILDLNGSTKLRVVCSCLSLTSVPVGECIPRKDVASPLRGTLYKEGKE